MFTLAPQPITFSFLRDATLAQHDVRYSFQFPAAPRLVGSICKSIIFITCNVLTLHMRRGTVSGDCHMIFAAGRHRSMIAKHLNLNRK